MKTTIQTLALVLVSYLFFSCQNLDGIDSSAYLTESQLKSTEIAVNDVAIEGVVDEVNYEADLYAGYEQMLRKLAHVKGAKGNLLAGKGCKNYEEGTTPAVSIDTAATGYPITITIDYGDGITTRNGRVISGNVVIEISAKRGTDGATRLITYNDCTVDSIGISGTCTETFNGDNITARKVTTSSDVTFTLADGTVIDRIGNHVREWVEGIDTLMNREDDKIQITGSTEVTTSTGDTYSRLITEPLIKLGDCNYFVQGIVQISQNGAVAAELNYGDGECDNLATVTADGETIEITLKDRMPKAKIEKHNGKMRKLHKGR